MDKDSIIKIINKELTILQDVADGFANDSDLHSLEIELAMSKVTDIYNLFSLLKDKNGDAELKQIGKKLIEKDAVVAEEVLSENEDLKQEAQVEEKPEKPVVETKQEVEEMPELYDVEPIVKVDMQESVVSKETIEAVEEPVEEEELTDEELKLEDENIEEESEMPEIADREEFKIEENEIAEKDQKPEVQDKPTQGNILADRFAEKSVSLNDVLSSFKKDKDLASLLKDRPVTNLKKAIKINDRIWYIKELFAGEGEKYNGAIEKINQLNNLDEALAYIFENFEWDQQKNSTISFLELIYRRFAQSNQ